MWPSTRKPIAPRPDRGVVDWRCCFCLAVRRHHVPDVVVLIPGVSRRSEWMFPAEVDADDLVPVLRDRHWIAEDRLFGDRKDATRAQRGDALGARLPLMLRVAVDDRLTLLWREVFCVINLHAGDLLGHVGNASEPRR